ncbi:MAG: glycosyltransferase family 87 protein [Kiritimatiellia bacterium]|jgi:hypothetical protein|nr:glycosyltransferase family 87 protein [Kiritimatiellia bacterium]
MAILHQTPHVTGKRGAKIVFCLAALAYTVLPLLWLIVRDPNSGPLRFGMDFTLRHNELICVRSGTDPYDVWRGTVASDTFRAWAPRTHPAPPHDPRKPVHVYPPWAYTYLYPLVWLTLPQALAIYCVLNLLAALFVFVWFWKRSYRKRGIRLDAWVTACASFAQGIGWLWLLISLNFGLLLCALLLLMSSALEKRKDLAAGLLWALIMLKVQIGVLFLIPLLFARRWKTIFCAGSCCFLASLWPAWLVMKSPFQMILNIRNIGSPYVDFTTGGLFSFLTATTVPTSAILVADGILGGAGCLLGSYWVSRHKEWIVRLLPAIACSVLWTYSQPHDRLLLTIPMGLMMAECVSEPNGARARFAAACYLGFAAPGAIGWVMTQLVCRWDFNRVFALGDAVSLWLLLTVTLVLAYRVRHAARIP